MQTTLKRCLTLVLACAGLSGCLGGTYEIPRDEAERLLQVPPAERGQRVHAVQRFVTATEVTAAEPLPPPAPYPTGAGYGPGYPYGGGGYGLYGPYLQWGTPYYQPVGSSASRTSVGTGQPDNNSARSPSIPRTGGGSKDGGAVVAAAIVAGVAIGVGLALSEGARYDGDVAVHPHHPVHLLRSDGAQYVRGLDELTPEDLQGPVKPILVGQEGAGLWLRGRAPLARTGFTFQFGAGQDNLMLPGKKLESGLGWRFAGGYFLNQWTGLTLESRIQRADNGDDSYHQVRLGVELQFMPIALWRLHLGGFAGVGRNLFASAGTNLPATDGVRTYTAFGAQVEVDLTTRLGLTWRYCEEMATGSADLVRMAPSWLIGLAVY